MKRLIFLLPLAALVALAVFAGVRLSQPAPTATFASPDRTAPTWLFDKAGGGGSVRFDTIEQPILVNFWASWCAPCEVEHPELLRLAAAGVPIAGVIYKDDEARAVAKLQRMGDPYANLVVDPTGDGGLAFGVGGVPETYLVARGRIVKSLRMPLSPADADAFLEAWRRESGQIPADPAAP